MVEASFSDEQIRADILCKLCRKKKWGGAHTSFDNLPKWCDHRLSHKYRDAAKQLITDGFLLQKPTHYGLEVSLNPSKRDEILEIINQFCKSSAY